MWCLNEGQTSKSLTLGISSTSLRLISLEDLVDSLVPTCIWLAPRASSKPGSYLNSRSVRTVAYWIPLSTSAQHFYVKTSKAELFVFFLKFHSFLILICDSDLIIIVTARVKVRNSFIFTVYLTLPL
jgi:hypothetical protein